MTIYMVTMKNENSSAWLSTEILRSAQNDTRLYAFYFQSNYQCAYGAPTNDENVTLECYHHRGEVHVTPAKAGVQVPRCLM
jgi:hypothetical protein